MRMPRLKLVPIPEVLAMENDLYYEICHRRVDLALGEEDVPPAAG